jgi:hypothetical protein
VRVLRHGGRFFEIVAGEQGARDLVEIFGRGQMAGASEKRSASLRRRLEEHGFEVTLLRDFLSKHVLIGGVAELAEALEGSPAIPDVDRERDADKLAEAAARLKVEDGLAWTDHRVVVEALKR